MTAAEIDTEGGIIFITLFKYLIIIKVSAPRGVLPDDDFSVCVACCSNFFAFLAAVIVPLCMQLRIQLCLRK